MVAGAALGRVWGVERWNLGAPTAAGPAPANGERYAGTHSAIQTGSLQGPGRWHAVPRRAGMLRMTFWGEKGSR